MSRASARRSVDLPLAFGPMIAVNSPAEGRSPGPAAPVSLRAI
jgi:hypothetical protein